MNGAFFFGRTMAVLLLTALLAGWTQCGQRADDPRDAYRELAQAFQRWDVDAAWLRLSADTRAWFNAAAEEVAAATQQPPPADGRQLLLEGAWPARPVRRVELSDELGGRTLLSVTDDRGVSQLVTAVREEGRWRIDLRQRLESAAQER